MNIRDNRQIKICFPFGLYLKQLFFTNIYVRYVNPFSFWRRYRINHLETCRELSIVKYLKSCHKLDYRVAKPTKIGLDQNYTDTSTNRLLQHAKLNTIYISQPRIKLKYRGVSYYTKDILNIDIHVLEIDPSIVRENNRRCTNDSDNANASEKSSSNQ